MDPIDESSIESSSVSKDKRELTDDENQGGIQPKNHAKMKRSKAKYPN